MAVEWALARRDNSSVDSAPVQIFQQKGEFQNDICVWLYIIY